MKNQKIPTWLGTAIIIIIAITIGTFVWKIVKNECETTQSQTQRKNELEQEKTKQSIGSELAQAQNKSRLSGSGCFETTDNFYEGHQALRNDFNIEKANSTVHYENKEVGISFDIPYNKKWGNKDCTVLPYLESKTPTGELSLSFGRPSYGTEEKPPISGNQFGLTVQLPRSSTDIFNLYKGTSPDVNPRIKTLGENKVVVYESYGMTNSRYYEVLGNRNNYSFRDININYLNGQQRNESLELEDAIKTLKIDYQN